MEFCAKNMIQHFKQVTKGFLNTGLKTESHHTRPPCPITATTWKVKST